MGKQSGKQSRRRRPGTGSSAKVGAGPGKKSGMQPQWQPIEALSLIAKHIDGMLEADREQYEVLLEARPKPHVLDDYTVNRVITAFTTQGDDFWMFEEQLKRWQAGELTDGQRAEVERLVGQMQALRENNTRVLELAQELSQGTIEKMMAKSDAELGLEMLLKGWPRR